ncbi:MAG: hypothetical protein H7Y59_05785 [Anaerolineales bacterium]|nr:hypothetical protein [Anaerolineales bacterium]
MKQSHPILIILFLSLLIGILTLTDYGESWDDLSLQKYADKSISAYLTWPQQGVVKITQDDLGNYGPSYVMAVALGSQLLNAILPIDLPDIRHLLYFITYLAGIWAFYTLGTRWLSQTAAIGATLLFMTQPLLWGHAFMNPKDTPFLAFFLLSLSFGFKMIDSIKPVSFDSLSSSARRNLAILTALWLVSVFSLFTFTDIFHALLTDLVRSAKAGETNIISLIASNLSKVEAEVYIQRYFIFFLWIRSFIFLLTSILLLFTLYRYSPATLHSLLTILFPAILLGFTTSVRMFGPFAGLIIVYFALRTKGRQAIPSLAAYSVIAIITMYLTWPYLWPDPVGHFVESLKVMSLYPWPGQVLFNGVEYASTALPYSYLPVLFGIQLTEPVWVLFIAGLVMAVVELRERRELIELVILWLVIPFISFIFLRSALYDNFRQIIFILPPIFLMGGVAFEKIKNIKWQIVFITICLIPGIIGSVRLHPYEYIYYNSFVGEVSNVQRRFELDYWGISYREAAEYVNKIAPPNAAIWVDGPSRLFAVFAREDLKVYSPGEIERAEHYDYVVVTTRYDLDKRNYPNAKIIYKIARGEAVLTVIKQP